MKERKQAEISRHVHTRTNYIGRKGKNRQKHSVVK